MVDAYKVICLYKHAKRNYLDYTINNRSNCVVSAI
jgi:hypothetical protein